MNLFSDKRGVELAISTIVIIAIAVLVVLVLVGYFLSSFGRSGSALSQLSGEGEKGISGIKLEQTCIGGSQCSGIDDEKTCDETTGCYWGFGQSSDNGGSGGSGGSGGGGSCGTGQRLVDCNNYVPGCGNQCISNFGSASNQCKNICE